MASTLLFSPVRAATLGIALCAGLAATLATPSPSLAQTEAEPSAETAPIEPFVEQIAVEVVNLEVFVTDRDGSPVTGLTKDDFKLELGGDEVPITNFYTESGTVTGARPTAATAIDGAADSRRPAARAGETFTPVETRRRMHLVVFLDHTRLRTTNRARALDAVDTFLRESLEPGDLVTVASLSDRLRLRSDFLYDKAAVAEILEEERDISARASVLDAERRQIFGELARGQSGGLLARNSQADGFALSARIRAFASQEYAAGLQSLDSLSRFIETLAGVPGRKALLYVSDGIANRAGEDLYVEWRNRFGEGNAEAGPGLRRFDFNTDYRREIGNFDLLQQVEEVGQRANAAGVTLYALDAEADHAGEVRSAATEQGATSETLSVVDTNLREPLELAAKVTGGRRFQASPRLGEELQTIAADFRNVYSLGFTPPSDATEKDLRRVEVKLRDKRRGVRVRHRESVELRSGTVRAADATVAAALYGSGKNTLDLELAAEAPQRRDDGLNAVVVRVSVPVARLALIPRGETHAARLSLFASVRDEAGDPGAVQKVPFHLDIPDERLDDALGDAVHYPLPVVLRPGDRMLAVTIRDEISGVVGTETLDMSELAPPR